MTEDTSLNDILNDEPTISTPDDAGQPPADPASAAAPSDQAPDPDADATGPARGPDGKFISTKGDQPPADPATAASAPPAQQDDEGPHVPRRALQDERSKRQQLEAELAQIRAQIAQQSQPAPQQEQGPPDRWEDPEGYDQWLINRATQAATSAAGEAFQRQRIEASALEAMQRIPDYQEKIAVFEQMAAANPALMQEMVKAPNPAEYAYNMAKTHVEITQYGGLDGLINARVQEALKAQAPASLADVASRLPSAPPSISSDRSTGARSGPAWGGPTPLGDILS